MAKYQIWDKQSNVYTPIGENLTPEMWIARYGWIANPVAIPVVAGGVINGAFIGELNEMKALYERMGAVFTEGISNEELLAEIEAFEDALSAPSTAPTAEERTATALEEIAAGATAESTAVMNALLGEE